MRIFEIEERMQRVEEELKRLKRDREDLWTMVHKLCKALNVKKVNRP